mmetsp:Transcript_32/g.97  ORF Transcript_32/g.97 Transcript_32/m.97 type:complete len:109 (-) Transcript_32:48-374(-)
MGQSPQNLCPRLALPALVALNPTASSLGPKSFRNGETSTDPGPQTVTSNQLSPSSPFCYFPLPTRRQSQKGQKSAKSAKSTKSCENTRDIIFLKNRKLKPRAAKGPNT